MREEGQLGIVGYQAKVNEVPKGRCDTEAVAPALLRGINRGWIEVKII